MDKAGECTKETYALHHFFLSLLANINPGTLTNNHARRKKDRFSEQAGRHLAEWWKWKVVFLEKY